MGTSNSKEPFKSAVTDLINNQQPVGSLEDDTFWDRYWSSPNLTTDDIFTAITRVHVSELMSRASGNLTALCFKLVSRICAAVGTACSGPNEHIIVINCVRLLTRLIPYLFESDDWRQLFWTPAQIAESSEPPPALAQALLDSLTSLLFCPDFTVVAKTVQGPEKPDDLSSLDSTEYIWENGIGCTNAPIATAPLLKNRIEIIKLIITCFSENLYISSDKEPSSLHNQWLKHFTSANNRHVLPLLASLLNIICNYDPVGYGVPYYYAMVADLKEELVEASCNLLGIIFNYSPPLTIGTVPQVEDVPPTVQVQKETGLGNLFLAYLARLHQHNDLEFLMKGFVRLISNPLRQAQTYLPASIKRIYFNEIVYILLWKALIHNQKFQAHFLRGSLLFDLLVPLLKEILDIRNNPSMVGMLHVGVFILLMLSGERNFGVRLNKPYVSKIRLDIPQFTGTHADLMFLVIHKIITSGLSRIQPMYDCLLTVLVNVSPYLKSLSMVTCTRLMHLMESFSTPWYLFAKPNNHYLVFYLLEIFNNIIQYQFDGNISLIYSIVRSKEVFYQLAALQEDTCLSLFPRPKLAKRSSSDSVSTIDSTEGGTKEQSQQPPSTGATQIPELQPIGQVKMEVMEVKVEHENVVETANEGKPDANMPSQQPQRNESEDVSPDAGGVEQVTTSSGDQGGGASGGGDTAGSSDRPQDPATTHKEEELSDEVVSKLSKTVITDRTRGGSFNTQQQLTQGGITTPYETLPTFSSAYDPPPKSPADKKGTSSLPPRPLIPLVKQSASANRKLQEPATKSDFKPTPEWVRSWKQRLPLHTILRLLQILVPQVEKLCTENNITSEREILEYLKNGTLVGLLPVPHPIIIRKYQSSESTEHWFHSYIWGVVYSRSFDPPIWYDTEIKLFVVNKTFE